MLPAYSGQGDLGGQRRIKIIRRRTLVSREFQTFGLTTLWTSCDHQTAKRKREPMVSRWPLMADSSRLLSGRMNPPASDCPPGITRHDPLHELIKERDRERSIAMRRAPYHSFGDESATHGAK